MANNRFYLYCPKCKEQFYLGKCLGGCEVYHGHLKEELEGVPPEYLSDDIPTAVEFLFKLYSFMTKHLQDCYEYDCFYKGEVFKILTEYDKRIK